MLEKDTVLASGSRKPESISKQYAALATAMDTAGTVGGSPIGYFQGVIDEPRIWNYARSQAEIQAGMGIEITSGRSLRSVGIE